MMENKEIERLLSTKDFIEFPEALNKKCTEEEFHKMMTSHNSDIPIEKVKFLDYSDTNQKL
jgi:hypothetical protein